MEERQLTGGRSTIGIVRIGDTVRRPPAGERAFQQTLLRHLEQVGFTSAPRYLGLDDLGRDILSFLPGDVPADLGHQTDAQLSAAGILLRRFHDATATMPLIEAAGFEVACHNDWAPTNATFQKGLPTGLIDFDTAAPGLRLWDLGYSAFTWLDLGNKDYAPEEQLRRLAVFVEAYDLHDCKAAEVAVFVLARQAALAASAARHGMMDMANWASDASGWTALNLLQPLLSTGYPPYREP